ncbi:MAG: fimbrillin family protein [Tannerellaceae bacterium]|jgi:hypothetical protein|nr:fimbrillin family protein [Tannerellaceae bacterium]
MKTRNLFAAALIAAVAFTSCSQDDDVVTNDPNIVRFNASVDGRNMTKASIGWDGTGTFDNGDIWGIYGKITTPESWPLDNEPYTVGTTTLYWDDISMDKPVTFSAYYPAVGTITDASAYMYNAVTATNPDLLVSTPVTASKGETVNLNFKHVMHKLAFNFDIGNAPGNILDIKYRLLNMKSTAFVNILDGTVDVTLSEGADAYPQKTIFEEVCVAPQDLTHGTDWIEIELAGKTYIAKVPANLNSNNSTHPTRLESGNRLIVSLTLKVNPDTGKTEVSITTTQISAWESQGQIDDVDANEQ